MLLIGALRISKSGSSYYFDGYWISGNSYLKLFWWLLNRNNYGSESDYFIVIVQCCFLITLKNRKIFVKNEGKCTALLCNITASIC